MVYETIIALRYLGSRRKNHFISVITVISCAGVAIGVWALIVVISVMAGFEADLRSKILETYAHVLIDRPKGAIQEWEAMLPTVERVRDVQGASPFLRSEVMISSSVNLAGVALKGVDTRRAGVVNQLNVSLQEGSLDLLDHPEKIPTPVFSNGNLAPAPSGSGLVPRDRQTGVGEGSGSGSGQAAPEDGAGGGGGERENDRAVAALTPMVEPGVAGAAMPPVFAGTAPGAGDAVAALMPPLDLAGPAEQPRVMPGVLIGAELKKSLLVLVGDEVTIVSPLGDLGPSGLIPRSRTYRVAGVFFTGMYEYDSKMVYVTLGQAQQFLGVGNEVSGIELRIDDPERSERVAADLQRALPPQAGLRVRDWRQLNASLFAALLLEKVAMFVILTLVTIVASFNIVASLIMVVLEKKREVAILKTLGTTDRGIARIFMTEGVMIGSVGMALGVLFGVATCWAISTFGIPLDQEVYYIDRLPVEMRLLDIALIAASAVLISFLATIYPSRLAARLLPVEGLRHE